MNEFIRLDSGRAATRRLSPIQRQRESVRGVRRWIYRRGQHLEPQRRACDRPRYDFRFYRRPGQRHHVAKRPREGLGGAGLDVVPV